MKLHLTFCTVVLKKPMKAQLKSWQLKEGCYKFQARDPEILSEVATELVETPSLVSGELFIECLKT